MSLDLSLKQLHVVHIKVFLRMQYIRLLLFYSVIFRHFPVRHFPVLQIPVLQIHLSHWNKTGALFHRHRFISVLFHRCVHVKRIQTDACVYVWAYAVWLYLEEWLLKASYLWSRTPMKLPITRHFNGRAEKSMQYNTICCVSWCWLGVTDV